MTFQTTYKDVKETLRKTFDRVSEHKVLVNVGLIDAAANEIQRLEDEIKRLRAVITRAKDALIDGQSTQWVHDLVADALVKQSKEEKGSGCNAETSHT